MHVGITVNFRRRRLKDRNPQSLCQSQHVDGPVNARLDRLHRIELVVDGRGGAGQVVDFVHLDKQRECYVVTDDFKARVGQQVFDVLLGTGEEVVHTDDFAAFLQQTFAEVGSQKSGSACDEDAFS